MKGRIARHGYKQKRAYNLRVVKPKKKKQARFCLDCSKRLVFEHGNAPRCGNTRRKTGCAYKHNREINRQWKINTKYHLKRDKIKMREYGRKYDKKRIRKSKITLSP